MTSCWQCKVTQTPLWRRGPDNVTLCNACGLHWHMYGKMRTNFLGPKRGRPPRKPPTDNTLEPHTPKTPKPEPASPSAKSDAQAVDSNLGRASRNKERVDYAGLLYRGVHRRPRRSSRDRSPGADASGSADSPSATRQVSLGIDMEVPEPSQPVPASTESPRPAVATPASPSIAPTPSSSAPSSTPSSRRSTATQDAPKAGRPHPELHLVADVVRSATERASGNKARPVRASDLAVEQQPEGECLAGGARFRVGMYVAVRGEDMQEYFADIARLEQDKHGHQFAHLEWLLPRAGSLHPDVLRARVLMPMDLEHSGLVTRVPIGAVRRVVHDVWEPSSPPPVLEPLEVDAMVG